MCLRKKFNILNLGVRGLMDLQKEQGLEPWTNLRRFFSPITVKSPGSAYSATTSESWFQIMLCGFRVIPGDHMLRAGASESIYIAHGHSSTYLNSLSRMLPQCFHLIMRARNIFKLMHIPWICDSGINRLIKLELHSQPPSNCPAVPK